MKTKYILNLANTKADDDIDIGTFILYFNEGISFINMYKGYKFKDIDVSKNGEELNQEYEVSKEQYINLAFQKLMATYVAYYIKKVDGYVDNTNPFYLELLTMLSSFNDKYRHLINDDLKDNSYQSENTNTKEVNSIFRLMRGVKWY